MKERTFAKIKPNGTIENIIIATPKFIETQKGEFIEYTKDDNVHRDGKFNRDLKKFITVKPFYSWILDSKGNWKSPKQKPNDRKNYYWDESLNDWKIINLDRSI